MSQQRTFNGRGRIHSRFGAFGMFQSSYQPAGTSALSGGLSHNGLVFLFGSDPVRKGAEEQPGRACNSSCSLY